MPIPAVAGIAWLGSLLGGIVVQVVTFFAAVLTKRLAIIAAALVIIVALTAGLFTALEALVAALSLAMPTEVSAAAGLVTPSNLTLCISTIVSATMLRYVYDWNIRVLQIKLGAL